MDVVEDLWFTSCFLPKHICLLKNLSQCQVLTPCISIAISKNIMLHYLFLPLFTTWILRQVRWTKKITDSSGAQPENVPSYLKNRHNTTLV